MEQTCFLLEGAQMGHQKPLLLISGEWVVPFVWLVEGFGGGKTGGTLFRSVEGILEGWVYRKATV